MIDTSSIAVGNWWPLAAGMASVAVLALVLMVRRGHRFPDVRLLESTAVGGGVLDYLHFLLGGAIVILLMLALMEISAYRSVEEQELTRDYLVVVDTSRSMRQDTGVLRANQPVTYPRRAGPFTGEVDNPEEMPELARYELARQSLLSFLRTRGDEDRVGLIYFSSLVHIMSGFTRNFESVEHQLAGMDAYVEGGTNIRWALEQSLNLIERYPGDNRRAIVLLTDAESRHTSGLQDQLDRLRRMGVSFYLLWITTDVGQPVQSGAEQFLRSARAVGSLYPVQNLSEGYLDDALEDVAELENFAYTVRRHELMDLSRHFFGGAQWLIVVWAGLLATLYLPIRHLACGFGGVRS